MYYCIYYVLSIKPGTCAWGVYKTHRLYLLLSPIKVAFKITNCVVCVKLTGVNCVRCIMAYFHCRTWIRIRTRIRTPSPVVTLYYAELFPLFWIWIRIPVQMVSQMVTVPILGTEICPWNRDPFYYISIRGSESEYKPVGKFCIVQESVSVSESESVSSSGNRPLSCSFPFTTPIGHTVIPDTVEYVIGLFVCKLCENGRAKPRFYGQVVFNKLSNYLTVMGMTSQIELL